jgi:hypothetical protein
MPQATHETAPTQFVEALRPLRTVRSMRCGLTKNRTRLPRPSMVILPSIPIASAQLRSKRQLDGFARSRWHPAASVCDNGNL